ncbi:GNAT family N-acetyltransferase [Thalassospira marina]|uniref:GNAT family N-acetyltransferase n=1 Tax=Thalassospira marina TaxID=2048283 RepID=A0A2N3KMS9_9PROT|nr:GNAT family N-acetyltransferase [Thalassospira marina]PKR51867.1 GNAT family N-acetyltransferase [Thalassospira marina]
MQASAISAKFTLENCTAQQFDQYLDGLAGLLHACVKAGASISFIQPFDIAAAKAFWQSKVRPGLVAGTRSVLIARVDDIVAGSVQLDSDTPPNQPHRAEVAKLLVHPDFRRQGMAKKLMMALEELARVKNRSLITLDTRTGDNAEPLYTALGYKTVGTIPGFAKDPFTDTFDATTIMYKQL